MFSANIVASGRHGLSCRQEEVLKFRLLLAIAVAAIALSVQAKGATLVYLVGLRHVYSVPVLPDPHELDRQQVEEDYAAAVDHAQKQYDTDMASIKDEEARDGGNIHQADRDAVQQNLEQDIADAADQREAAFSQMYSNCDYVRANHPEFKVDQDGPYRVIEVDAAPSGVYQNVIFYPPYPLYVDVCPFGWAWGRPYPFATFGVQVGLFHSMWIGWGCPVFAPMFYGGSVFVVNAPMRESVIMNRGGWVGGRPPMITAGERTVLARNYAAQNRSGYFSKGPGGRPISEFKRTGTGSRFGGQNSGVSKYSRQRGTSTGSDGFSHRTTGGSQPGSTGTSRTGGYGHSGSSSGQSGYSHGGSGSTGVSRYTRGSSNGSTSGSRGYRGTSGSSGYSHGGSSDPKSRSNGSGQSKDQKSHGSGS